MDMKTRSSLTLAIIILTGLSVGIAGVYAYSRTANTPTDEPGQVAPTKKPAEQQKVFVKLPGADPVPAMTVDYFRPDSLWVVVNKNTPLRDLSYIPTDLQLISGAKTRSDKSEEERSLRSIAMNQTIKFLEAAKEAGHDLMIGSAFRSYELQNTYYTNYARTSGQVEADKFSAKPGYSEHQTGLVIDVAYANMQCYLEVCFGQTEAGKWLAEHATEHGFILRYPADKVDVTGYQYEPWHFRYVGAPLARALNDSGLTLDEAYSYLMKARDELLQKRLIVEQ